MNSERYNEIVNIVRHDVYTKRRGLTSKGCFFIKTRQGRILPGKLELIENFGWEVVLHTPTVQIWHI